MSELEESPETAAASTVAGGSDDALTESRFFGMEPDPALNYPLNVVYCGYCTMPLEYCMTDGFDLAACKSWLERALPDLFAEMYPAQSADGAEGDDADKRPHQKRGGKSGGAAKQNERKGKRGATESAKPQIKIGRMTKSKRKSTVIVGLKSCGVELKVASKTFGQKLASGASVTGDDEITVQGDRVDDVIELILEKWPDNVSEKDIVDCGEMRR